MEIQPTSETITPQIQPKDSAEHIITEENLRFAEDIKISLLKRFLHNPDFENLIDNLIEYYNSLGPDLFEHRGKTLQELILIRTAQVLAEKGNKEMKFYLNDIRKKVVEVYESGFGESDIISRLKERGFDEIGLEICRSLFRLHANKIGPVLERIEVMTKALAFTEEDPTSKLWFVSMMVEIDPKFNAFYEKINNSRLSGNERYSPEKIRQIICHPLCYNTLKARFNEFKKFFQEKVVQLDLEKINKIIERVYTFADTEINYAGELGQQIALQSTKQINKKDGKLSLSYVAARVHNNGTLDDAERESEQGKSGTDHAPNADEMNSVFDQIIANSDYNYTNQPKNSPNTAKDLDDVVPPPENNEDEETWQDYLARLQSLADNFEEKKVSVETGLRKETILGRIEHEKAVHRIFRAIEIIVSEMKIEGAIVTKKATITNPTNTEKKHNYRADLVLILPGGNTIILEAKNTTELFGQASQQVGIYAGAAKASGQIWLGKEEIKVRNIHTVMIFAKGPEKTETATHSQNFIEAQQKILQDQIVLLDDPNWIWNLLNLIRNKGLLNQENVSTTRSAGFLNQENISDDGTHNFRKLLKKTEPKFAFPKLPNSQEIFQKVLENDRKYCPKNYYDSLARLKKFLEANPGMFRTAFVDGVKDGIKEIANPTKELSLSEKFMKALSPTCRLEDFAKANGIDQKTVARLAPLFNFSFAMRHFLNFTKENPLIEVNSYKDEIVNKNITQVRFKTLADIEAQNNLDFTDGNFDTTLDEVGSYKEKVVSLSDTPDSIIIFSAIKLYLKFKQASKQNFPKLNKNERVSLEKLISEPIILTISLHVMVSIRIGKILDEFEAERSPIMSINL